MGWLKRLVGNDKAASAGFGAWPIRFDTAGWKAAKSSNGAAEWRDVDGDTLRLCHSSVVAPHSFSSSEIDAVREHYRQEAAAAGGGIVSVELCSIQGLPCVEAIKKFERRPAYVYEGVLALELRDAHCVFNVESIERGTTGVREAIVTAHLAERGDLSLHKVPGAKAGEPVGWFLDPYLDSYRGPTLHSLSDDERLDALFPKHPLSKVRRVLVEVAKSLSVDAALRAEKSPSTGPSALPANVEMSGCDRAKRPLSSTALGTLYAKVGRNQEAVRILNQSMQEAEKMFGAASPQGADAATELGRVLLTQEDSARAKAALAHAAELCEGAGLQHQLAVALLLLGFACERLANLGEAEAALRKARAALEGGPSSDPLRGQIILNLGRFCVDQQKVPEAESLFEEALRLFANEDPSKGSNSAIARNGLGLVYVARARYEEAIPQFESALQIFEAVHGPDYPDVATVLRNMAFAWKKLGDERKARQLLQRAERIGKG